LTNSACISTSNQASSSCMGMVALVSGRCHFLFSLPLEPVPSGCIMHAMFGSGRYFAYAQHQTYPALPASAPASAFGEFTTADAGGGRWPCDRAGDLAVPVCH